jgi:hypothetical protein
MVGEFYDLAISRFCDLAIFVVFREPRLELRPAPGGSIEKSTNRKIAK